MVRVLLQEEVVGRDAATRRMRRKTANFPTGKTFSSWRAEESSIPVAIANEQYFYQITGADVDPEQEQDL